MIEARPDWVLSRQRAWGVPLTCFVERPAEGERRDPARPGGQRPHRRGLPRRGRRRLVRRGRQGALPRQRPRPRRVGEGDRHPRRLVRFRLDPRLRAARPAGRALAGEPLSRGHRPAPRLVPVLDAAGLRHPRPRALRGGGDPRLHARRERHEDVEVARQHRGARGGGAPVRRRHPAPLGGAVRLRGRPAHRPGDPQGRRRRLPPAAQHAALPARRARTASPKTSGSRRRTCPSSSAGCCTGWPSWTRPCARATPATTSSTCSRACSSSAPWTSRRSISTSARTRSTATPRRARGGGRRARCSTSSIHRLTTWLAPMLPFTMEEVWLERFPGDGVLGASGRLPRDARGLASTPRSPPGGR